MTSQEMKLVPDAFDSGNDFLRHNHPPSTLMGSSGSFPSIPINEENVNCAEDCQGDGEKIAVPRVKGQSGIRKRDFLREKRFGEKTALFHNLPAR